MPKIEMFEIIPPNRHFLYVSILTMAEPIHCRNEYTVRKSLSIGPGTALLSSQVSHSLGLEPSADCNVMARLKCSWL